MKTTLHPTPAQKSTMEEMKDQSLAGPEEVADPFGIITPFVYVDTSVKVGPDGTVTVTTDPITMSYDSPPMHMLSDKSTLITLVKQWLEKASKIPINTVERLSVYHALFTMMLVNWRCESSETLRRSDILMDIIHRKLSSIYDDESDLFHALGTDAKEFCSYYHNAFFCGSSCKMVYRDDDGYEYPCVHLRPEMVLNYPCKSDDRNMYCKYHDRKLYGDDHLDLWKIISLFGKVKLNTGTSDFKRYVPTGCVENIMQFAMKTFEEDDDERPESWVLCERCPAAEWYGEYDGWDEAYDDQMELWIHYMGPHPNELSFEELHNGPVRWEWEEYDPVQWEGVQ